MECLSLEDKNYYFAKLLGIFLMLEEKTLTHSHIVYILMFLVLIIHSKRGGKYPIYQLNGKSILPDNKDVKIIKKQVYVTNIGVYQNLVYKLIIHNLRNNKHNEKMPNFENMESFGYTMLQKPLEALNIVFPIDGLDEFTDRIPSIEEYVDNYNNQGDDVRGKRRK